MGSRKLIYLLGEPQSLATKANLIGAKLYFSIKKSKKTFQKKQNRVAAVFTRRGDVFVKPIDGGEAYYVQSSNELSDLSSDVGEINTSRDAVLEHNSFRN